MHHGITVAALCAISCAPPSGARDATRLAALAGQWQLRLVSNADTSGSVHASGRLSLLAQADQLVGAYTLDSATSTALRDLPASTPSVVAMLQHDTIRLVLASSGGIPIELVGEARDDSISGTWKLHQRAGSDVAGKFVLRRVTP